MNMSEQLTPVDKVSLDVENYILWKTPELIAKERDLEYSKYRPDVSDSEKNEIKRVLAHLSFEIAMRTSEFDPLG
jgi:hypothetical protein